MRGLGLIIILLVGFITSVAFAADPLLDLKIAGYFQQPDIKDLFHRLNPYFATVRNYATAISAFFVFFPLFAILAKLIWPQSPMLIPARAAILTVATFALGPGLLANGILKSHWHRPRPEMVTQFGGKLPYVQWWDRRGACGKNCSFISGEAAAAASLLAPAVIVPPPWRYPAIGAVVVYGTGISFLRLAFGRHFLTDIIFAGVFTALIVWFLHGIMFRWKWTRLDEASVERALEKTGLAIRSKLATAFAG